MDQKIQLLKKIMPQVMEEKEINIHSVYLTMSEEFNSILQAEAIGYDHP